MSAGVKSLRFPPPPWSVEELAVLVRIVSEQNCIYRTD